MRTSRPAVQILWHEIFCMAQRALVKTNRDKDSEEQPLRHTPTHPHKHSHTRCFICSLFPPRHAALVSPDIFTAARPWAANCVVGLSEMFYLHKPLIQLRLLSNRRPTCCISYLQDKRSGCCSATGLLPRCWVTRSSECLKGAKRDEPVSWHLFRSGIKSLLSSPTANTTSEGIIQGVRWWKLVKLSSSLCWKPRKHNFYLKNDFILMV